MEKKKSLLGRFVSYYKNYRVLFFFDMLASFVMSGIAILYPILTRKIFNDYVPAKDTKMIIILGVSLIGIYFIRFLLKLFVDYYGHSIGAHMQEDMRRDLFEKIETLPYAYFDEHETGQIMSRMTNDLMNVSELAHHGPENIFICTVSILGAFIYLLTINWILSLIILCCVPILFFISLATRKKQLAAFSKMRKDLGTINARIESSISGVRVTKAFNNKNKEIEKFDVDNKECTSSKMQTYKVMAIHHASTNFVVDLFNVACIVGGGILTISANAFSLSDYLAFAISISLFTSPINVLLAFLEQFHDGAAGFKRFIEILDEEPEQEKDNVINDITLTGAIKFNNVSFKYETSEEVLKNVSFDIQPGETIALVGESGGGKTTICHLLPRFYRISEGQITFDNIDINDISLKALRDNIGIVQQDVFLFNGTIKDNILYGRLNATDEEVYEAMRKANILPFVESLPNGFDTQVGERGVKLSGGQKQRISIARIFLKNPSILILDEATSALDNTTELYIQDALNELTKGRTCIIVAHRLSTIKNANRIFVVNNGQIAEQGSHKELMELNGEYAMLYNEQFAN